jgi:hypothetical protein
MVKFEIDGAEIYFSLPFTTWMTLTYNHTCKQARLNDLLDASFEKGRIGGMTIHKELFNKSQLKNRILDYLLNNEVAYTSFEDNISPMYIDSILIMNLEDMNIKCLCKPQVDCTPCSSGRYPWREWMDSIKWEEKSIMPYKKTNNVEITKIVTHNNMVTIVYFSDGTFTKAICSKNDTYDLDVGIQVCLMKKMLGDKRYFKTMEYAHKLIEKQEQDKKDAIELKRKRRDEQKKREEKNRKARKEAIDRWKNDITDAVKSALSNKEDDLK